MTWPRYRPRSFGAAFALLVAVLAAATGTVSTAAPAAAAPATSESDDATATNVTATTGATVAAPRTSGTTPRATKGQIDFVLVSASPTVLTSADTLTVVAEIRNGTDNPLTGAEATLGTTSKVAATRSSLANWADADVDASPGREVASVEVPTIEPGKSAQVTFTASSKELGVGANSDWGPRRLGIVLDSDGSRLAAIRTFAVWSPTADVTPVGLTVLAAVTGPAVDATDPAAGSAALEAQTASGGRLGKLLAATKDYPVVGWVADPQVIRAARADPATEDWANRLLTAQNGRDVLALPDYDVDLAAYAHHPTIPVPDEAVAADDPTSGWRRDVAWPADATPDLATVALDASRGATSVIVRSGMDPSKELTYTPSGVATVTTPAGSVTALLADDVLSTTLAGTSSGGAADTQRVLAETAVVAREQPSRGRTLLAVLDRTWKPDVTAFDASISALESAPWVQFSSVDELRATPVPDLTRENLPESTVSGQEISGQALATLRAAREQAAEFSQIVGNPGAVTGPIDADLAAPTSIAYRTDPKARQAAVNSAVDAVATMTTSSIELAPRKTVRVLGQSVNFPVLIRNSLDQPATVEIVLVTGSSWLVQTKIPQVTIPANGETSLDVPVRATASGSIIVQVHARAVAVPAGTGVDVTGPIDTRVVLHPKLDTVGSWVVVIAVALLLIAGIWRTIRRGRSPRRTAAPAPTPAPAPDPEHAT